MKTRTKKPTCSACNDHEGQTAADTNKKFEAMLSFKQHSRAKVIIEAESLAEAEEMAGEIQSDEVDDWNPIHGEVSVDSVQRLEGGQSHE